MRQTIIGSLVVLFGFGIGLVAEHYMSAASELAWRWVAIAVALTGLAIVGLSEPVYPYLRYPHQFPKVSTAIVAVIAALIVGALWWFCVLGGLSAGKKNTIGSTASESEPASTNQKVTTVENVESHIREWLGSFSGKVTEEKRDPRNYFAFSLVFGDGKGVAVSRRRDTCIILSTGVSLAGPGLSQFNTLTGAQKNQFFRNLAIEITRGKIRGELKPQPSQMVIISNFVPINSDLTEERFIDKLDDTHSEVNFILYTTDKLLTDLSGPKEPMPPSSTPDKGASPR